MNYLNFSIGQDDIDRRMDRVTRKFLETIPISILYKNIRNGFIRINGKKVHINYRVQNGDVLCIEKNLFEKNKKDCIPKIIKTIDTPNITTVFCNEHLRIINKPKGINVQASFANQQSLDYIIKDEYIQERKKGLHKESLSFMPGPLHRLDRNTTGLLVFSQSLIGAQWFSNALAEKRIEKKYLTILSGHLNSDVVWEHLLSDSKKNPVKNFATVTVFEKSDRAEPDVKLAQTIVKPLAQGYCKNHQITLALIQIKTGRTHQIRAQGAFCGHPLIGDSAYGGKNLIPEFLLHAWTLKFPIDNPLRIPHKLIADLPPSFTDFIKYHLPNFNLLSYNNADEISK